MRTVILHIGTEKTGTSTLQIFLQKNRARLHDNGFHFPAFAGHTNQTKITAFATADDVVDDLRMDLGVTTPEGLAAFRAEMERAAAAEVAKHPGKTFIISNEHLSSRLNRAEDVARLKAFLERHFDRVLVAVYLRRQDQVAVSLYSTLLKFGGDRWDILPDPRAQPGFWDYGRMLSLWEGAFGREAVRPRIFDREELAGRSVVSDFCETWGLGAGYEQVRNANESLRPAAGEVLRRMNTHFPGYVDGGANRMRGELGARFGQLFPGRGVQPSRAEAEAFYAHFRAQNEAVRAEWFPDRETLFREDFSAYPESPDPRAFSFDEAVEVMVDLWRRSQGKELELRHDIAIRDGQIAELEGRLEDALAHYRRAQGFEPGRPRARHRIKGVEVALSARRKAAEDQPADPPGGDGPDAESPQAPTDRRADRPGDRAERNAAPPVGDRAAVAARWAAQEAAEARMSRLRKRLSLNGIRRLFGAMPR